MTKIEDWTRETTTEKYQKAGTAAEGKSIVLIIGEGPSITRVGECDNPLPLAYQEGMRILHESEVGWLNMKKPYYPKPS